MSDSTEWPDLWTDAGDRLELPPWVEADISITTVDAPDVPLENQPVHGVTHDPTGISEEYKTSGMVSGMNPNALRDTARRQLVRDHPEIAECYDDGGEVRAVAFSKVTEGDVSPLFCPECAFTHVRDPDGEFPVEIEPLFPEDVEEMYENSEVDADPSVSCARCEEQAYPRDGADGEDADPEVMTDGGEDQDPDRAEQLISGFAKLNQERNRRKMAEHPGFKTGEPSALQGRFGSLRNICAAVREVPEDVVDAVDGGPDAADRIQNALDDLGMWRTDGDYEPPELRTDGGRDQPPMRVEVDGREWNLTSPHAKYDAIHAAAGAVLADADQVTITEDPEPEVRTDGGRAPMEQAPGIRPAARDLSEFREGQVIGFWNPITLATEYGGSTPPVEWIYELGTVEDIAPFDTRRAANPPDEGYQVRQASGVLKIAIHHPDSTDPESDEPTWNGDISRSTTEYVHPNMVDHVFANAERNGGEVGQRILATEDGFPTSLASDYMAVTYDREDVDVEIPTYYDDTGDGEDPEIRTDGGKPLPDEHRITAKTHGEAELESLPDPDDPYPTLEWDYGPSSPLHYTCSCGEPIDDSARAVVNHLIDVGAYDSEPMTDGGEDLITYEHRVECPECGEVRGYTTDAGPVAMDQDAPFPFGYCSACGADIEPADVVESREVVPVPMPELREDGMEPEVLMVQPEVGDALAAIADLDSWPPEFGPNGEPRMCLGCNRFRGPDALPMFTEFTAMEKGEEQHSDAAAEWQNPWRCQACETVVYTSDDKKSEFTDTEIRTDGGHVSAPGEKSYVVRVSASTDVSVNARSKSEAESIARRETDTGDLDVDRAIGREVTTLPFADEHVDPILAGEKDITLRYDLDTDLEPGDSITLTTEDGTAFATATVDMMGTHPAEWFANTEWDGHREYENVADLLDHLSRYYPNADLTPDTELTSVYLGDITPTADHRADGGRLMTDGGEDQDGVPLDDALREVGVPEDRLESTRERVQDHLGNSDPRMPITLREDAFATVDAVEVCDGADGHECVRGSPVLLRGEDEIHVTNYASAASRSGRRVLCGECRDKQNAVQLAENPDLDGLYTEDEIQDLRERFPGVFA